MLQLREHAPRTFHQIPRQGNTAPTPIVVVQIFIGGESDTATLDEVSVITAPYEVDGKIVGTVGVVGPTRMTYERVIPVVDVTAKLLSSALSHH